MPSQPFKFSEPEELKREWLHSVFGCFDDCSLCVFAFFCPCVVFGRNAAILGESCGVCGCVYCLPPFGYAAAVGLRGQLRSRRGITGSLCQDMAWTACFPLCTLTQEAAEIKEIAEDGGGAIVRS